MNRQLPLYFIVKLVTLTVSRSYLKLHTEPSPYWAIDIPVNFTTSLQLCTLLLFKFWSFYVYVVDKFYLFSLPNDFQLVFFSVLVIANMNAELIVFEYSIFIVLMQYITLKTPNLNIHFACKKRSSCFLFCLWWNKIDN